jgi:hypothetical protein
MYGKTSGSVGLGECFRIQLYLIIAGGIGIIAIFLPFTFNLSPWAAALASFRGEIFMNEIWHIALPAFLPVLITIATLRWLIKETLSLSERMIAYVLSATSVCITLSLLLKNGWPKEIKDWFIIVIPVIALVFGIFVLLRNRHNTTLTPFLTIIAMQIAYMVNCLLCLTGFFGGWQIGAYCSLVTVIVYLIQMILVFRNNTTLTEAIGNRQLGNKKITWSHPKF